MKKQQGKTRGSVEGSGSRVPNEGPPIGHASTAGKRRAKQTCTIVITESGKDGVDVKFKFDPAIKTGGPRTAVESIAAVMMCAMADTVHPGKGTSKKGREAWKALQDASTGLGSSTTAQGSTESGNL